MVGIEGTGTYGAGLCEFLLASGIEVVEDSPADREWLMLLASDEPTTLDADRAA